MHFRNKRIFWITWSTIEQKYINEIAQCEINNQTNKLDAGERRWTYHADNHTIYIHHQIINTDLVFLTTVITMANTPTVRGKIQTSADSENVN